MQIVIRQIKLEKVNNINSEYIYKVLLDNQDAEHKDKEQQSRNS